MTIVVLLPIIGAIGKLFWNMAILTHTTKQSEKSTETQGKRIGKIDEQVAILEYTTKQNSDDIKTIADRLHEIDEQSAVTLLNMSDKIDRLGSTLIEVTTGMQYVQRDMEELKTDIKQIARGKE